MNCLIYSRVSSEEQAQNGRSIDDQVRICEKFAQENGYMVSHVYKDPGKSGTNMNRPGLTEMLLQVREDKTVKAVLVQDTDRLARNPGDHLQMKALLKKHCVQLISVSQPMVSGDDPESNLVDIILAGINAFQSQITGRKTSKVMEQKVIEGWWPGPARIGYVNSKEEGKNIIEIDNERASYIRQAFELYSTGTQTLDSILAKLNSEGFRTRAGKKVSKSVLATIIKNPFYTGKILYKGKLYEDGRQKPIITWALFERCQQVMSEHNRYAIRIRKHKYLLRGILFCGTCGTRAYAEKHIKRDRQFDYYYCKSCGGKYGDVEKVETQVAEAFKYLKLPESMVKKIITKAKGILAETHGGLEEQRQLFQNRLNKLEKRRNVLETNLLDGTISKDTYQRQHSLIEEEIFQVNQEMGKLKDDRSGNIKVFEQLLFMAQNIHQSYLDADYELKKQYLRIFWERFELKDGRIEKAVPTKLFQALLNQKSINPNSKVRNKCLWLCTVAEVRAGLVVA